MEICLHLSLTVWARKIATFEVISSPPSTLLTKLVQSHCHRLSSSLVSTWSANRNSKWLSGNFWGKRTLELTLNAMGLGSAVKFSRSKCTEGLCEMRCLCLWKCRKERKWERWLDGHHTGNLHKDSLKCTIASLEQVGLGHVFNMHFKHLISKNSGYHTELLLSPASILRQYNNLNKMDVQYGTHETES